MGILGHLTAKKSFVPGIISWQNYASEHEFSHSGVLEISAYVVKKWFLGEQVGLVVECDFELKGPGPNFVLKIDNSVLHSTGQYPENR